MPTKTNPSQPDRGALPAPAPLARFQKQDFWICLLLFLLTAAIFFPALTHDFVEWDDDISVYRNPHIQSLSLEDLHWMFTDVNYSLRYKPLSWLAYALIFAVYGLNPFGYHLAGLCFHAANVFLLYLVLRQLLAAGFPPANSDSNPRAQQLWSALAALLWGLNPLRVEPVVWATTINYGQALFFTLLSLLCHLRAAASPPGDPHSRRWLWLGVGFFALAMLSYPVVFGYAAVLVVLDIYPLRRFGTGAKGWRNAAARKLWLEKLPYFFVAGLLFISFYGIKHAQGIWTDLQSQPLSPLGRLMQAAYVLAYFLWKPWFPAKLMPVYTTLVNFDPLAAPFVASLFAVIALTLLFFLQRRRWPAALAAWICYLILMVPALGLTQHPHYTSDRYSYIPGVLWSVVFAAVFAKIFRQKRSAFLAAAVTSVLVFVSIAITLQQIEIWQNSVTLFQNTIWRLGNDPYRADLYRRLGQFQLLHEQAAESLAPLQQAVRLDPNMPGVQRSLGVAFLSQGRVDDAIASFQQALKKQADDPAALEGYGLALCQKGQVAEAIPLLRAAVKADPDNAIARTNLDAALARAAHDSR